MLLLIQLNCDCNGFNTWLWPLIIAFILGAFLGWLLSKMLSKSNNETDAFEQKYLDTKSALENCRKNSSKTNLIGGNALGITNDKVSKVIVDSSKRDKLTKVEGIGPKIQGLLYDDGIYTWKQLAEVSVERIQGVLDKAGPRYRVHNPGSWPKQAAMCANGEWEKLKVWQDEHKGGRE